MKKFIWLINSAVFLLIIVSGGIAFWVYPKQNISIDENRTLMRFPEVNANTIFSGKFEKEFEEYYNDHFPLRNDWLELANVINSLKGIQEQEVRVLNVANTQEDNKADDSALDAEMTENNSVNIENEDALVQEDISKENSEANSQSEGDDIISEDFVIDADNSNNNENVQNSLAEKSLETDLEQEKTQQDQVNNAQFSKVNGLVIVNNRVLQIFAGSKNSIKPYIKMMNTYRQKLPEKIKMYAMIAPAGSDFYLPNKVTKGVLKEKENIQFFEESLSPNIISIPTYDALSKHKNEYIYFKTDHHWTGLGAYYAYVEFAKKAGFEPLALEQMAFIRKEKSFLGSLYNYTKDKELRKDPDILEYYKVPSSSKLTMYHESKKGIRGSLYGEKNNSYLLFIGGDYPLGHIRTENNSSRKLLVIKDSFGNALIPYLSAHYSDIYVVDYRYFKNNVVDLMKRYQIDELLYVHNTFAANSTVSVKYGLGLLNRRNNNAKKP